MKTCHPGLAWGQEYLSRGQAAGLQSAIECTVGAGYISEHWEHVRSDS